MVFADQLISRKAADFDKIFIGKGDDAFVAPRRNGPHTVFMSDREIERSFRERFQRFDDREHQLQALFKQAGQGLNPEQGVVIVIVCMVFSAFANNFDFNTVQTSDQQIVELKEDMTEEEFQAEVRGRELMSGLPKTVLLSPEEVRDALAEPVGAMVDSVITCLGQAPPELAQDLITQGLYLVGGGSLLRGLDRRLALETEVPVRQAAQPLETVVLGAGRVIESYEALQAMFMDARKGV